MAMEDFIVKKENSLDGQWYMYIGFKEMRLNYNGMVTCCGSAIIRPDDESEYFFSYAFNHSLDWREVSGITLKPIKRYGLSLNELNKIGSDIFYNINEFISRMN